MKKPKASKAVKKGMKELLKKSEKPMISFIQKAKESGDEYRFYLAHVSMAKTDLVRQEGQNFDEEKAMIADSMMLAMLFHYGASYKDVLRVAQTFDEVTGLLAAMEMINQSTE